MAAVRETGRAGRFCVRPSQWTRLWVVIAEPIAVSIERINEIMLANAAKVAPSIHVVSEEVRDVNNQRVLEAGAATNTARNYLCFYSSGELQVEVAALDLRAENGRVQACIPPIAGHGQQRVD